MRLMSVLSAAALAAAVFVLPSDADAQRRGQGASVVVLNVQRVIAESALGRDMAARLDQVRQQVLQEAQALQPEGQSIEQELQRLRESTRNMSAEQIRNSSTYGPQFESVQQRLAQFQQRGQVLQGDFECSQIFALRDLERQLSPVVRSVMESRGAGVVLSSASVQYASPDQDITQAVIQQLDQTARTATVARHSVSECQAQQQQQ